MPDSPIRPKRFALFDRDGTIMIDKVYQKDPSLTEFYPNSIKGMKLLQDAGWGLVLITNQSGIARGYISSEELEAVNESMAAQLKAGGVELAGMYFCPHLPSDDCRCRKPLPGMAEAAAADLGFAIEDTVVIGDRPCDIELGKAIGGRTVLVRTGGGEETEREGVVAPDFVADDLLDAAEWIVGNVWPGRGIV